MFFRKKLFNAVHFFVHLNLALTLLIAFTVFIIFIETVRGIPVGSHLD